MPQIHVTLLKGRAESEIAALGSALTEATARSLGVSPDAIRVTVTECEPEHWFVAGESMADLRAAGRR
ncbi:tautomerase family protein [Saccharothrix yanglingensis]|uniref:4-oxalocrotonate tautomerase n=1 Tax=Saccharothrix yanglingensis TaxID=659496 RepID=A0ABU0WUJ8_9PSEU|nr:tautomerase family protein [Saccharothrix yanglingensis]MDQ2583525.1 4-oxalocrotonate tautomerase [Saccharothrix yanglingensis]